MSSRLSAQTVDGWPLDIQVLEATGTPVGAVLLTHAMMVDRRTYLRDGRGLAPFLAAHGWRVYNADFRGRGSSGPTPQQGGVWTYDDIVFRDLPALVQTVRTDADDLPLVLVGHSLGGHTSMAAAGCGQFEIPPEAYVLLSANVWRPSLEPSGRLRLKKGSLFWLFDRVSRPLGYFPSQTFRMGPCAESYPYIADLYRTWAQDRWTSGDGQTDFTEGMRQLEAPVLSVVGQGDKLMAHPVGAKNWFDVIESNNAEFWLAQEGLFGLSFDPDHMTLVTAPESRPLWESVERWMRKALGVG